MIKPFETKLVKHLSDGKEIQATLDKTSRETLTSTTHL